MAESPKRCNVVGVGAGDIFVVICVTNELLVFWFECGVSGVGTAIVKES